MASALLKGGFAPNAGLDRSSVVELWHVWNITGWSVDNTEDVVFSQTRAEGASHPDLGDAICKNRVLKDRWASPGDTAPDGEQYWQAIVAVYFDSSSREFANNPRSTIIDPISERFVIPYWKRLVSGVDSFKLCKYYCDRCRIRRVEVRHARTGQITESQRNTIFGEVGKVYFFGIDNGPIIDPNPQGVPFLFKGPKINDLSNGLTRLFYVFETTVPILGLSAGALYSSGSIVIPSVSTPPLSYLDEYVDPDTGGSSPDPIVTSIWERRHVPGGGLPYL